MRFTTLIPTLVIGVSSLFIFSAAGVKLVKTKITNEITVGVPKEMHAMTPEDITQRFPSVRAPLGAFTTENRLVDFSVNVSATQWPDGNLDMSKQFFRAGIVNLYDKVDIIKEEILELHGKKFIHFEFESRTNGDRRELGSADPIVKYTQISYHLQPGRTLVFAFNCPRDMRSQWQETATEVMKSIRIK